MELKYKTGMIFRSETHPQFDMIISFVNYAFDDRGKIDNYPTLISWCNINKMEFSKFVNEKLGKKRADISTAPYAFFGEGKISTINQRIKKYNLKYEGCSEDEIVVYTDDEWEYCSGFKNMSSELSK